jgi:DNA-binding transcriptional MerR regulator
MAEPPLVPTGQAARTLGISSRTLQRYVRSGLIIPDLTLASGQYRWDVARLREQINALAGRDTD